MGVASRGGRRESATGVACEASAPRRFPKRVAVALCVAFALAPVHAARGLLGPLGPLGTGGEARHSTSWSSRAVAPPVALVDPAPLLEILLDPAALVTPLAESLIHAGLAGALPEAVVDLVRERVPASAPLVVRRRALRVLGALGDARAIDHALVLTEAESPRGESALAVSEDARHALTAILARDPEAYGELRHLAYFVSAATLRTIAQAAGGAFTPEGLELLTGLLGWKDDADFALLTEIRRTTEVIGATNFEDAARGRVRERLDSRSARVRGEAAALLGSLRDLGSLERLIVLLGDAERLARDGAYQALRAISGATLPPDPAAWRAWIAAEREWVARGLPDLADDLVSDDRARAVRAIGTCAAHALFRDDVAQGLVVALSNENSAVRRLACQALARIGSEHGVEPLSQALEDPDESVRMAAQSALAELAAPPPLPAH